MSSEDIAVTAQSHPLSTVTDPDSNSRLPTRSPPPKNFRIPSRTNSRLATTNSSYLPVTLYVTSSSSSHRLSGPSHLTFVRFPPIHSRPANSPASMLQ